MNTDVGVLLRSALDQLPNGIVVLDDENKLAFANKSALMLQGHAVTASPGARLPHPPDTTHR